MPFLDLLASVFFAATALLLSVGILDTAAKYIEIISGFVRGKPTLRELEKTRESYESDMHQAIDVIKINKQKYDELSKKYDALVKNSSYSKEELLKLDETLEGAETVANISKDIALMYADKITKIDENINNLNLESTTKKIQNISEKYDNISKKLQEVGKPCSASCPTCPLDEYKACKESKYNEIEKNLADARRSREEYQTGISTILESDIKDLEEKILALREKIHNQSSLDVDIKKSIPEKYEPNKLEDSKILRIEIEKNLAENKLNYIKNLKQTVDDKLYMLQADENLISSNLKESLQPPPKIKMAEIDSIKHRPKVKKEDKTPSDNSCNIENGSYSSRRSGSKNTENDDDDNTLLNLIILDELAPG